MSDEVVAVKSWDERFEKHTKALQGEIANALLARVMTLHINPTEKCNFRCTYCYEDFAIGKMKPSIVDAVKRLLDRSVPGLRALNLSWFGGEPLLAPDVMFELSEHAQEVCNRHSVPLLGQVTTNAFLLTVPVAARLCRAKQTHYQVSFDGAREEHDKLRVQRGGSGSFDGIWNNLVELSQTKLNFFIVLRLHLRQDNEDSLTSLLRLIDQEMADDPRFAIMLHPLGNYGGSGAKELPLLNQEAYAAMCGRLARLIQRMPGIRWRM